MQVASKTKTLEARRVVQAEKVKGEADRAEELKATVEGLRQAAIKQQVRALLLLTGFLVFPRDHNLMLKP